MTPHRTLLLPRSGLKLWEQVLSTVRADTAAAHGEGSWVVVTPLGGAQAMSVIGVCRCRSGDHLNPHYLDAASRFVVDQA